MTDTNQGECSSKRIFWECWVLSPPSASEDTRTKLITSGATGSIRVWFCSFRQNLLLDWHVYPRNPHFTYYTHMPFYELSPNKPDCGLKHPRTATTKAQQCHTWESRSSLSDTLESKGHCEYSSLSLPLREELPSCACHPKHINKHSPPQHKPPINQA